MDLDSQSWSGIAASEEPAIGATEEKYQRRMEWWRLILVELLKGHQSISQIQVEIRFPREAGDEGGVAIWSHFESRLLFSAF